MKRMFLIAVAIIMSVNMVSAQTASETKAADLLKKASNKIKAFTTMEVNFSYVMENSQMGINESLSGKVFSKGDKYRMTVGDNIFISDGKTVWNYLDELDEIHINTVENSEGGLSPTALLSDFATQYQAKFIKQESHKGKMVDIIDLVPNTPQSFYKYRVALDARDQMLVYTIAYDRHGGTYTYTIENIKPNQPIPDTRFVFNRNEFPADVDIVDMR
jgi:outer membrane lipoprotein carrier protein